ncbi:unnamed protein product [Candidula unifasciata]|uniref:MPN domain-containing protein n=1 Tax=Candidula unifasciata TaxID=100452 RepID=A0A8S3ZK38_9EUPU|nr:unnamed protein product [Candidula unifasciata]
MSVYLDGTTLSALLFTNLNSNGCQYGFLTGEKIEQVVGRISDSQIPTYDVSSYIYISSFVPWPSQETLYSRGGHIKEKWVKSFLTGTEQKLIGWYSFRHNTATRPSLREITLHNSLATSEMCAAEPKDFLFFLCTSSVSPDMSTHTFSHGFMHVIDGHFVSIPMTVMNLGDTMRTEYKNRSPPAVSHSKTVAESLHGSQKHFVKPSGEMDQITKMNRLAVSINKSLKSVHSKVFESEAALGILETDVGLLKQKLELLEVQESKRMQIKADKQRHGEKMTQFQQPSTNGKEQLETLLINLGVSSGDKSDNVCCSNVSGMYPVADNYCCSNFSSMYATADNNCCSNISSPYPAKSFSRDSYFLGEHFESFQIIGQTPSLSVEHGDGNSVDINTYSVVNDVPATTVYKFSDSEQGIAAGMMKMNAHGSNKPQTVKDKVEEAFSFLNDEIRLQKETNPQLNKNSKSTTVSPLGQRKINPTSLKSADLLAVHSGMGSKKLVADNLEFGRKYGESTSTHPKCGYNPRLQ